MTTICIAAMAGAATPPSTDGLVLRLDAADHDSLTLAQDGTVDVWEDRSPAGNHARADGDGRAVWHADALNGRPAVRFDGNARLRTPPIADSPGHITLFAVFERPDDQASDRKWQRVLSCWDGRSRGDNKDPSFLLCIKEGDALKPTVFSEMMSGRHRGEVCIGASAMNGANPLHGLLAEVLVYDRGFLVDEQIQQVKTYLREKWGIPEDPDEAWTRQGILGMLPHRRNDLFPLSDQTNAGNWTPHPPMWDEFDGRTTLDANTWWDHNPNWYGRAPARFLGDGQNVFVRNGTLRLVMKHDPTLPPAKLYPKGEQYRDYSSASVVSKDLVLYGYFEIRARAMNSAGSSAFWFSSRVKHRATGKPYRSEIDVFEIGGKAPGHEQAYHMNAHIFETPADGPRHWSKGGTWNAPFRLADEFHVFGLEWTPDELVYYVDGIPVRRMRNTHWHAPQRLLFDSETMGSWLGMPKNENLPSTFHIDYVRAWKNEATRGDWQTTFEPCGDPRTPTRITEYVRSMDAHGK